jgi:hypothetical protein
MPSSKYISIASSRLSSFKGYISQVREEASVLLTNGDGGGSSQNWKQWAGQKIKGNRGKAEGRIRCEEIVLFPGWATKRYHSNSADENSRRLSTASCRFLLDTDGERCRNLRRRRLCFRLRLCSAFARVYLSLPTGVSPTRQEYCYSSPSSFSNSPILQVSPPSRSSCQTQTHRHLGLYLRPPKIFCNLSRSRPGPIRSVKLMKRKC